MTFAPIEDISILEKITVLFGINHWAIEISRTDPLHFISTPAVGRCCRCCWHDDCEQVDMSTQCLHIQGQIKERPIRLAQDQQILCN